MTRKDDIDDLFSLPLGEFTAARNALASRLRKSGQAAEAERVKAIPKPPATAWAVNQLYWRHRKEMDRLFAIGEKVRRAQTGSGGDLRALLEERRAVLASLADRAAEILRDAGHAASQDAKRRMAITLDSLAASGRSSAETEAGRLTSDLEPLGFDGVAAMLGDRNFEPAKVLQFRRPARDEKNAEDAAAARERAAEALKAAEKARTAARREAERAEAAVAKANARAEALETQKREIETRYARAREEAREAAAKARKAAQALAEAERRVAKLGSGLEKQL